MREMLPVSENIQEGWWSGMNVKLHYFSAIKFLSKYIRGHQKHFLMFYMGWLFDSVLTVITPILLGIMIDEIVYYQNLESFIKLALIFFICILFSGILYFLVYAQHGYLMNMFVFSIRKDVFRHLQKCDARYLSNITTGEVLAILQDYSEECMHFVIRNIIHFVNGILLILAYGSYLVILDWRIGIIAFSTAIFSVLINTRFKGRIRNLGNQERECYGKYVGWMYEVITALRDIRMLGAKEKVEETFEASHKTLFKIGIRTGITSLTAENILNFVNLSIKLTIYAIAAYLVVNGSVTLGMLTVIFSFYENLAWNINATSRRYLDAQNRISFIQKIYDFLHAPVEQGGTKELHIEKGKIVFQNASFGYSEGESVLKNISFKINPGEHMAVVGKSGCGKSTLAYLLIGFYQLQSGEITIDGQKLKDCTLESIRREVGLVQQDVLVFDGTIRENLLMGNFRAQEKRLLEACQHAGLGELIASLPDGLDTVIGSQGMGLSGGQKQRIAIARIYLKNPAVIIFDEATSALDNETEEEIHQLWQQTLAGKTAIVIAHRLSSVMLCEKVVFIENGQIVEMGRPTKMAEESDRFKTLFVIREQMIERHGK